MAGSARGFGHCAFMITLLVSLYRRTSANGEHNHRIMRMWMWPHIYESTQLELFVHAWVKFWPSDYAESMNYSSGWIYNRRLVYICVW